jgi:hypothetical protein
MNVQILKIAQMDSWFSFCFFKMSIVQNNITVIEIAYLEVKFLYYT